MQLCFNVWPSYWEKENGSLIFFYIELEGRKITPPNIKVYISNL